jgi:hypothetical protein
MKLIRVVLGALGENWMLLIVNYHYIGEVQFRYPGIHPLMVKVLKSYRLQEKDFGKARGRNPSKAYGSVRRRGFRPITQFKIFFSKPIDRGTGAVEKIALTGYPRFDLLRTELRVFFQKQTTKLR